MGLALAVLTLQVAADEGVFGAVGVDAEPLDELEAVTGHARRFLEGIEPEEGLLSAIWQGLGRHELQVF